MKTGRVDNSRSVAMKGAKKRGSSWGPELFFFQNILFFNMGEIAACLRIDGNDPGKRETLVMVQYPRVTGLTFTKRHVKECS